MSCPLHLDPKLFPPRVFLLVYNFTASVLLTQLFVQTNVSCFSLIAMLGSELMCVECS